MRVLFNWNILALWLIVFGFLAFLVYAIVATDMSATVLSLIFEEPTYLSAALFCLFLLLNTLIITYALFAGSQLRNTEFCYRKVSHLPMKPIGFYFAETLVSFVDVWFLILIPFLLGTIWGLHLYSGIATFFATTAVLGCFVLLLGIMNQFILYVVDCLFRFIGGRLIRFMAFALIVFASLALFWPAQILKDNPAELLDSVKTLLYQQKLFLSPIGLVADGISRIANGNYAEIYYIHVPALSGYLGLFFFLGYSFFKLSERLRIERHLPASRKPKFDFMSSFDRLIGLIWTRNERLRVLFAKEFTYILRSPRVTMFCTLGAVVVFLQFRGFSGEKDEFAFALFMALSWTVILLSDLLPYLFSYDEKAIRAYFFCPVNEKEMILSKNFSLLVIVLLFQLAVCGLGRLELRGMFSAEIIQGLIIAAFYLYFVSAATSNYSTIISPRKVRYGAVLGRSFHRGVFVLCLFAAALPVSIYSFFSLDFRLVITSLSVIAWAIYIISLKPLSRKLAENKEDFVHEISG